MFATVKNSFPISQLRLDVEQFSKLDLTRVHCFVKLTSGKSEVDIRILSILRNFTVH